MSEALKMKTVKMVELEDWDNLVERIYGRNYSFQQQDECKPRGISTFTVPVEHPEDFENDTVPEEVNDPDMGVSFSAWLARDPAKTIESDGCDFTDMWWHRNFYPHVDMIINDLHVRGILEAGEFIINIDW